MEGRAISLEEKQALRCDIQEQEVLMQGYQKVSTAEYNVHQCVASFVYVQYVLVFVVVQCCFYFSSPVSGI